MSFSDEGRPGRMRPCACGGWGGCRKPCSYLSAGWLILARNPIQTSTIRREQHGSRRLRAEHHFDESLQLFDRAWKFAEKVQFPRAEASESLWDRDELLRDRRPRVVRAIFSSGRWQFAQWRWTDADEWQPSGRLRRSMRTTGSWTRRSHGIARRCSLGRRTGIHRAHQDPVGCAHRGGGPTRGGQSSTGQ